MKRVSRPWPNQGAEARLARTEYHAALTATCAIALTGEVAELKRRTERLEAVLRPPTLVEQQRVN